MGWQLWTSPETGYRRVGTRFLDVRELFTSGITVKAIYEPLKSCPIKADAIELKCDLERRDFDLAGVVDQKQDVVGYVDTAKLDEGKIEDYLEAFNSSHLIADSTPIPELFSELLKNNQLFVLSGSKISGIVTVSDLNKPPVRIYLFGIISLLEMHLTYWINELYNEESWVDLIPEERLMLARKLLAKKRDKNQEIDLVNCLQFADKKTVLVNTKIFRKKLALGSKKAVKKQLERAQGIRDNLAHSQNDIAIEHNWEKIHETLSWAENLLSNSDRLVES
jgi:hypothetical protein